MGSAARKILVSLTVPGGALLVIMAMLLHWNVTSLATPPVVDFYRYTVLIAGVLLAWRFRSGHVFFALLLMGLASGGLLIADADGTGQVARNVISVLLPVNIVVLGFSRGLGFTAGTSISRATAFFIQSVAVLAICRPEQGIALAWLEYPLLPESLFSWTRLPQPLLLVYAIALILLLARYVLHRRTVDGALFWALAASALAMRAGVGPSLASAYLATGALILVVALVETSYRMAFHDELTGMPGRRAFNQALLTLGDRYSVAMVDVDHFKKFNDLFGHDTGDQVLRMVASRLARTTGGAQAFRYGGEEFAILFPGKLVREALSHAELVRSAIAATSFTVRGPDRSQRVRQERRQGKVNRRVGYGGPKAVGVTVSMGIAEPHGRMSVAHVMDAADKALYAAKENGRNRIEVATWARTTSAH